MVATVNTVNHINISASENVLEADFQCYDLKQIEEALSATLDFINEQMTQGLTLPYFADIDQTSWQAKPKSLDVYVIDPQEGQALNLEARNKDYATNILSYPSDLPPALFEVMEDVPLGELIICHAVLNREAKEQNKRVSDHITHLLVHGILHLLGFDHELGQAQQNQMEQMEIAILKKLQVGNPYV